MEKKKYIEAGKIINTHGVAGEVKIEVWLDSPEFFRSFKRLFIAGREVKINDSRVHKGFLLAKLEGVEDVNDAMRLKNTVVSIDREDAKLPEGAFFLQDIVGAEVLDESGKSIGTLTEVMDTPASPIYVVKGEAEHLIPAVPEFIMSTDPAAGIIRVRLIEGM